MDKLAKMAAARGEAIGIYAARILDTPLSWTRMRAVYTLIGLARTYGNDPVEQDWAAALELDVISVPKVKSIVEKGTGKQAAQAARSRQAGDAATRVTAARFARDPREFATATGVRMQVLPDFEAAARRGPSAGSTGLAPRAVGGVAAATRTLPRDLSSSTGRERELTWLIGDVTRAVDPGHAAGIYAIGGMAGIGKTSFAVHAAHLLSSRFPDGQIFLPLHGHTPGLSPVEPREALASLLQTAGVAAVLDLGEHPEPEPGALAVAVLAGPSRSAVSLGLST